MGWLKRLNKTLWGWGMGWLKRIFAFCQGVVPRGPAGRKVWPERLLDFLIEAWLPRVSEEIETA